MVEEPVALWDLSSSGEESLENVVFVGLPLLCDEVHPVVPCILSVAAVMSTFSLVKVVPVVTIGVRDVVVV